MSHTRRLWMIALVVLSLRSSNAADEPAAQPQPTVLVVVNGEPITQADLDFYFLSRQIPEASREKLRDQALEQLIDQRVIAGFLAERKAQPNPAELDFRVQQVKRHITESGDDPAEILGRLGYTEATLRRELALPLAWRAHAARVITRDTMREYFDAHRFEFDGTTVRASQILLKLPANADDAATQAASDKLTRLRQDIIDGRVTFADAAAANSEAPSKKDGGDVGWFAYRGRMPAELSAQAFKLEVAMISQPFRTPFGLHLLTVTERKPGLLSLEDARPQVFKSLSDNLWDETVRAERDKAKIEREEQAAAPEAGAARVESMNARRPVDDADLRYWLENMIWHHRFSDEEVAAATGLTLPEVVAAREKFDIRADNKPERAADAALLVLPYPGGRHPRIGFLEGAVNPQRESKVSVFCPWDDRGYVVVDVPEAIWSNLGLTYLAHTHVETVWSKQGVALEPLEWNRRDDGTFDISRTLPNGIAFGAKVVPGRDAIRMELWLTNGTNETLTDLRVQNCVMLKAAPGFNQQTNDNKVTRTPFTACRNEAGDRWIITAWESCHRTWNNAPCPCLHSDPKFPDCPPGETKTLRGWLSFYEGTDVEAEFERIDERRELSDEIAN